MLAVYDDSSGTAVQKQAFVNNTTSVSKAQDCTAPLVQLFPSTCGGLTLKALVECEPDLPVLYELGIGTENSIATNVCQQQVGMEMQYVVNKHSTDSCLAGTMGCFSYGFKSSCASSSTDSVTYTLNGGTTTFTANKVDYTVDLSAGLSAWNDDKTVCIIGYDDIDYVHGNSESVSISLSTDMNSLCPSKLSTDINLSA